MTMEISYKGDNTGRQAINDLIRWFGLSKTKKVMRCMRAKPNPSIAHMNMVCMAIEIGGVSGEPVRRLFAYVWGEERLADWLKS